MQRLEYTINRLSHDTSHKIATAFSDFALCIVGAAWLFHFWQDLLNAVGPGIGLTFVFALRVYCAFQNAREARAKALLAERLLRETINVQTKARNTVSDHIRDGRL